MATGRLPDPNTAPLTAKGDLYTYSTVPARLAVGNNGDTLVADSSATTGLRWQGDWNTGKNKIINGDFGIWQRGTSFSNPANGAFTADRFAIGYDGTGATRTVSQQAFTPGTAPASGYEANFFYRYNVSVVGSGNTGNFINYFIEDVRTVTPGQPVTVSLWAKADTNRSINAVVNQYFGSGGSGTVFNAIPAATFNLTTSWQRFSFSGTMASISGKTIGAGNYVQIQLQLPGNTTQTIDTWGWQVELGSVATPFTTATGTLAGELAACERYYYRWNAASAYSSVSLGTAIQTTQWSGIFTFPSQMRVAPTVLEYATLNLNDGIGNTSAFTNLVIEYNSRTQCHLYATGASGMTQYRNMYLMANNSTAAYLAVGAEL